MTLWEYVASLNCPKKLVGVGTGRLADEVRVVFKNEDWVQAFYRLGDEDDFVSVRHPQEVRSSRLDDFISLINARVNSILHIAIEKGDTYSIGDENLQAIISPLGEPDDDAWEVY